VKHFPGLFPTYTEVHESFPTVGNKPIFLDPPPEFLFTKDPAFLALDAALYKVIYIIVQEKKCKRDYKKDINIMHQII
jgi:hypothetical protein